LLTRPGEAIYNDANGLYEGNHPFQVVWLPDDERETYLERIGQLAAQRHHAGPAAIVFEGNLPADPGGNACLHKLLAADCWPEPTNAPQVWLGDAVAIKDPTSVRFARQGGSNLLLVGHREDLALGIMGAGVISLAAQDPPGADPDAGDGARFFILDGIRPDAPEAGFWQRLTGSIPHCTTITGPRDAAAAIGQVADEVERRRQGEIEDAPPIYLCVYNLARFRELRRREDDFGFSRLDEDQPASPAQQFATILREGPMLGVHTIVWGDTFNNVSNSLDRQGIREMETASAVPDERHGFEQPGRLDGRRATGRPPCRPLPRGIGAPGEVPPVPATHGPMARLGQSEAERPFMPRGGRCPAARRTDMSPALPADLSRRIPRPGTPCGSPRSVHPFVGPIAPP